MFKTPDWYESPEQNPKYGDDYLEEECESLAEIFIEGKWHVLKGSKDPRKLNHICVSNRKRRNHNKKMLRYLYSYEIINYIHRQFSPDPENLTILKDSFEKMSEDAKRVVELITSEHLSVTIGIEKMDLDPYRISAKVRNYFGFPTRKWRAIRKEIRGMLF